MAGMVDQHIAAVNDFTDVLHKPQQRLAALLADNPAIDEVSLDVAGGRPVDFVQVSFTVVEGSMATFRLRRRFKFDRPQCQ